MNNFRESGNVLTLTAPEGGVVSGGAYLIDALLVIAAASVAADEAFEGVPVGIFRLPKPDQEEWSECAKLYFDEAAGKFTTESAGNTLIGVAARAAVAAIVLTTDAGEGDLDVGESGNTFIVGDYTALAGAVVTVSVNGATAVTLTEGVDFDAETSNDVTASNLADAINAQVSGAEAEAYEDTVTVATAADNPATGHVRLDGTAR